MTITLDMFRDSNDVETYDAGQLIFDEGDFGDSMYVVLEGEVEIVLRDEVINTLSPGEIFGEMALVDNRPRSAAARAKLPTKLIPVNRFSFTYYVQNSPFFALEVMEIMAERLRQHMDRS
ncbi:MAG: Crp/Fnr family transcriptional regulator [Candidatus Promineifilaceae bacterium]